MKRIVYLFLFFVFITLTGVTQFIYDSGRNYFKEKKAFLALPKGKTLKIVSFGYSEAVADLLYIWAIQFYSDYSIKNGDDYIEDIFNLITDISPQYKDPYMTGAVIMVLEKGKVKMGIRLLQKAAKNIKDDWIFDFDSGYYASHYLKDYKLAEKYFSKASRIKGAPGFVKRLVYHQIYLENDLKKAWVLWNSVKKNAKTCIEKDSSSKHLYQIKYEIDKKNLENAIKKFKKLRGFYPRNLKILVKKGFIKFVPRDYKGNEYKYNNRSGIITAIERYSWKR